MRINKLRCARSGDIRQRSWWGRLAVAFSLVLVGVLHNANAAKLSLYAEPEFAGFELRETGQELQIRIEGRRVEKEGHPALGIERMSFILPPDTDLDSLRIVNTEAVRMLVSTGVEVAPAGRIAGPPELDVQNEATLDEMGREPSIYGETGAYPRKLVRIAGTGRMRNIKYVDLEVTRQVYIPTQNHALYDIMGISLDVEFEALAATELPIDRIGSRIQMRAQQRFVNYEDIHEFYPEYDSIPWEHNDGEPFYLNYDYVIITTDDIVDDSSELENFRSHKESLGFRVYITTVESISDYLLDSWGCEEGEICVIPVAAEEMANQIRWWLQDHYLDFGIEYVLFIGDPDPDSIEDETDSVGEVPMKMCWPCYHRDSGRAGITDYYFADLTGDWDLDGDRRCGEYEDDVGTGGVDLCPEVIVGRIPTDDIDDIDSILAKFIAYEEDSGSLGRLMQQLWRSNVLLPMSWLNDDTDGAYLAEDMKEDFLDDKRYSTFTMYQHETVSTGTESTPANSVFSSDMDLTSGAVASQWSSEHYGMVCWRGHGSYSSTSIGCDETGWTGTLMRNSSVSSLSDDYPSFVVQVACNNARSDQDNLAARLLANGGIGVVGAAGTSYRTNGQTEFEETRSNAGIAYGLIESLVENSYKAFGDALYEVKADLGMPDGSSGTFYKNLLVFNLYGDPSMQWRAPRLYQREFDPVPDREFDDDFEDISGMIADWIWE